MLVNQWMDTPREHMGLPYGVGNLSVGDDAHIVPKRQAQGVRNRPPLHAVYQWNIVGGGVPDAPFPPIHKNRIRG